MVLQQELSFESVHLLGYTATNPPHLRMRQNTINPE
jgi:hypothetical protein